jgi:hypothetical protein
VYFYLQTSPYHTSVGAFTMPSALIASDTGLNDPDLAEEALRELEEAGLIVWDAEEEVVAITNFLEHRAPTSRKHLAGIMRALELVPKATKIRQRVAAELTVAIFKRAREWTDPKAKEARAGFLDIAAKLIKDENLQGTITDPSFGLPDDLLIALSDALLIELPIKGKGKNRKGGGIGEGGGKVEGEVEFEEEREEENQNLVSPGTAADLPADSGQRPTQDIIAELTAKARAQG